MILMLSAHLADSLLLSILGIAFLLAAVLLRGFSGAVEAGEKATESGTFTGPRRFEVASPVAASLPRERVKVRPLLSVDVEDYFQTEAMSQAGHREHWDDYPLRVVESTKRLLDVFDEFDAKATFFTVGWIADRVPGLVREIADRGHELACHSYWHRTVYSLTPQEFRSDTRRAIAAIEDAAGVRVDGYRAPTWSITRDSTWALRILAEEGFAYDSSIYPIHHDLYGIPGAMVKPHLWNFDCGDLLEIPPATYTLGQSRIPAAGGGYLRMFPVRFSCMAINQIAREQGVPVVYMHPWEIDPEQPRLQAPYKSRMRQYWGLNAFEGKLRELLARYEFVPFRERVVEMGANAAEVTVQSEEMAVAS